MKRPSPLSWICICLPWILLSCLERDERSDSDPPTPLSVSIDPVGNIPERKDAAMKDDAQKDSAQKDVVKEKDRKDAAGKDSASNSPENVEVATLGAGCFWCIEAVLEQIDGVKGVKSGYMGGRVDNPTYESVCSGQTGHAEVVQVTFDPDQVSFENVLDYFWKLHDPTTLNRQGNDVGSQYRSAIFYHSEAQRKAAEKSRKALSDSGAFEDPVVTEIVEAVRFFEAEDYHQDYYRLNKQAGYCRIIIAPKLDKLGLKK